MKILISVSKRGEVFRVDTVRRHVGSSKSLQTEDDVLNAVKKYNEEVGYEKLAVREVDDIIAEAFAYLLGEKGYKTAYYIEDICNRTDKLQNSIEYLSSDLYDISEAVNTIKSLVDKLNKKEED